MAKANKEFEPANIKIIGIGGGGGNAISRMADDFPRVIELVAINTDAQDLGLCRAKKKINIGKNLTRGRGTGMNPELGRQAAEENRSEIAEALKGADMIFITAGMGGGTGTGAAPIVAETAKELGILTIAVVTKPFTFEGAQRLQIAHDGVMKLRDRVDTLITIPNDRIFALIDKNTSLMRAFEEIDEVLMNSVMGITELITSPGIINVDFADVKTIMQDTGSAIIGIGKAGGNERALNAAKMAVNSPLLEFSIEGAKGVLFNVSGTRDLKMNEINEIAKLIAENVDSSAKIIFGTYYDRKLKKGQLKVTVIATGFSGTLPRSGSFLPNLFSNQKSSHPVEEEEVQDTMVEMPSIKSLEEEEESEQEKTWEVPAFLRRKKKSRRK